MADYDWFDRDYGGDYTSQQPSITKVYGEEFGFDVIDSDSPKPWRSGNIRTLNEEVVATAVLAWCNWCACSVRPSVASLRVHRRICTTSPFVSGGDDDESLHVL